MPERLDSFGNDQLRPLDWGEASPSFFNTWRVWGTNPHSETGDDSYVFPMGVFEHAQECVRTEYWNLTEFNEIRVILYNNEFYTPDLQEHAWYSDTRDFAMRSLSQHVPNWWVRDGGIYGDHVEFQPILQGNHATSFLVYGVRYENYAIQLPLLGYCDFPTGPIYGDGDANIIVSWDNGLVVRFR